MWNETNRMKILQNSFSQRMQLESSQQNSSKSFSVKNNQLTYFNNEQLLIDSDERLNEKNIGSYDNFRHLNSNKDLKIQQNYYDQSRILNPQAKQGGFLNNNIDQLKEFTSQLTRPSYQINNSLTSLNNQQSSNSSSSSSLKTPSKKLIQRKLNASSRKSLSQNQSLQKKQTSANPYMQTTFSKINNQQSGLNNFSFQQPSPSRLQNGTELSIKTEQISEQNEIKSFRTVTHVPYYEKYIEYEPQVIMVPKQKIIQKQYVVENLVDYVPVMKQYTDGYELVPQQVIQHKLQYQLVQQKIVHLPKDNAWLKKSKEKKVHKKKTQNNVDSIKQNIYLSRNHENQKSMPNQFSNYTRTNNFFDSNPNQEETLENKKLVVQSPNHRKVKSPDSSYQNLVNYFLNYEPLRNPPQINQNKPTFHVISQKSNNNSNLEG